MQRRHYHAVLNLPGCKCVNFIDAFNDLWMKSSRDEVRPAENSLFVSPWAAAIMISYFEITPEAKQAIV